MTQTATDTRVSGSSTITLPETIPPSEINQRQASTNYDKIKYVTPRLTIFRERMKKAHDAGDPTEQSVWTAARDRELEQLANRDFDAAYNPFLDYVRQTEQMSELAFITDRFFAHQLTGRHCPACIQMLDLNVRYKPHHIYHVTYLDHATH